jgi:hypothetical protein
MPRFDRAHTPASVPGETRDARAGRGSTLRLDGYVWEAVSEEAAREGLTAEELVGFAVLYYLADVDSGRISRQVARSPHPQGAGSPR